MPHEIRIPRLGWSMEEGTFVGWLKKQGEHVAVGEALFELDGEKAEQEIESVDAGILHIPENAPAPGSLVRVGSLLGYLLLDGESAPTADFTSEPSAPAPMETTSPLQTVEAPHAHSDAPISTPRARRVAAELEIDWTKLHGTGRSGRIREADVRNAQQPIAPDSTPSVHIPITSRRKQIAAHLRHSLSNTIPVTLTTTIDATHIISLRNQFKSANTPIIPTFTDILAALIAPVLLQHRPIASRWEPDHHALRQPDGDRIDISIAVDTPAGLLVPVLRDVARKSLADIAAESRALVEQARSGSLPAEIMQGGFFTITNLGAFGIDAFTPIINYPQVAILGAGAIRREPVFLADGTIIAQDRMTLSLTFDHAAVDGAPAAAFLRDVSKAASDLGASFRNRPSLA